MGIGIMVLRVGIDHRDVSKTAQYIQQQMHCMAALLGSGTDGQASPCTAFTETFTNVPCTFPPHPAPCTQAIPPYPPTPNSSPSLCLALRSHSRARATHEASRSLTCRPLGNLLSALLLVRGNVGLPPAIWFRTSPCHRNPVVMARGDQRMTFRPMRFVADGGGVLESFTVLPQLCVGTSRV